MTDRSRPAAELERQTRATESPTMPLNSAQLAALVERARHKAVTSPPPPPSPAATASGAIPSGRTCIASAIHRTD